MGFVKSINIYECDICGKRTTHIFRVQGNIYFGEDNGLIGNNIDNHGNIDSTYICHECFLDILDIREDGE